MKKIIPVILSGVLAFSSSLGMTFSVLAEEDIVGDVNGDGKINAADAAEVLILCAKAGAEGISSISSTQQSKVDYNQDGTINASDAEKILVFAAKSGTGEYREENTFHDLLLNVIGQIPDGGGYYTGRATKAELTQNAWEGMDKAVTIGETDVTIDMNQARPSFCSSAVYMTLLKTLSVWDTEQVLSMKAWQNLKPYTVQGRTWAIQDDGVGCWGRANANGSGFAVLAAQLGAGENTYIAPKKSYASEDDYFSAWKQIKPGDFVKLFWNEYIGANSSDSESGHMVVFLGFTESTDADGKRTGTVRYWSSNGSGYQPDRGYGISETKIASVYRAVSTRITHPEAFANAEKIMPDNTDTWLYSLNGSHLATEKELLQAISPVSEK